MYSHPIDISTHSTPRIMLAVPLIMAAGLSVGWLAGLASGTTTIWGIGFFIVMAAAGSVGWARSLGGTIEVSNSGIVQRSRGVTMTYPRADILSARVVRFRDALSGLSRFTYRILFIPMDRTTVQIELKRGLKKHWWFDRFSPEEAGIPLGSKKYFIQPRDPSRFIEDARQMLGREIVPGNDPDLDREVMA
jgi:hypothetical protein